MSSYVLSLSRISVLFALSACASVNADKDFLCKAQAGSPCTTIAATDGTERGAITPVSEKPEDTFADVLSQKPLSLSKNASSHPDGGISYTAASYRSPEKVGTLWIAPFLDEDGILHESRYVHFVIAKAAWRSSQ